MQEPEKSKLDWALQHAAEGMFVFPCAPGAKTPAIAGWPAAATRDAGTIRAWWSQADYNIGIACEPSNIFVVDIDPESEFDALSLPPTRVQLTPRGGQHYVFRGTGPTTASKLAAHTDTRGAGGYILGAGSLLPHGRYALYNPAQPIAETPRDLLAIAGSKLVANASVVDDLDSPIDIERALRWLSLRAPAIEGNGGDAWTFETCCYLRDFGISLDVAFDILTDWNNSCEPPWSADELATKVYNAYAYAQNGEGSSGTQSPEIAFAGVVPVRETYTNGGQPDPFKPYTEEEQDAFADTTWLIKGWLQSDSIAMLYGPPDSYKTFLALEVALSLSAGLPCLGRGAGDPCEVLYVVGEGATPLGRGRRQAWRQDRAIVSQLPYRLVTTMPMLYDTKQLDMFMRRIQEEQCAPRLVVFDTLQRFMTGLNENDSKDASLAIEALERVRRELGCTVLVIHHTGKDVERGERGHSVFRASFSTMIEAKPDHEAGTVTLRVDKQKDDDRPAPITFHRRNVARSLVFDALSPAQAKALVQVSETEWYGSDIGRALGALGAYGLGNAVTTKVLAGQMVKDKGLEIGDPETNDKAIAHFKRALDKAKDQRSYVLSLPGAARLWGLHVSPKD